MAWKHAQNKDLAFIWNKTEDKGDRQMHSPPFTAGKVLKYKCLWKKKQNGSFKYIQK